MLTRRFLLFVAIFVPIKAWFSQSAAYLLKKTKIHSVFAAGIFITQATFLPSSLSEAEAIEYDKNIVMNSILSSTTITSNKEVAESILPQYLSQPTEDRPQIMLPKEGVISPQQVGNKRPIVQGLLYLRDPGNSRPQFSDTLVITVSSGTSEEILAGAKIPVTKVRFPTQINLYKENILPSRMGDWESEATKNNDLFVSARICPESSASKICSEEESTFRANGISKVVKNLPGMEQGDVVRTAASLGL